MRTPFLVSPPPLPAFRQQNCASLCVWRYNNVPLLFSPSLLKTQHFSPEQDTTPLKTRTALAVRFRIGEHKRPFS